MMKSMDETYEWECTIYIPHGMTEIAWGDNIREAKIDAVKRLVERIHSEGREEIEFLINKGLIKVLCRRIRRVPK